MDEANETDERIDAWQQIATHPIFKRAYDEERPLIVSIIEMLDDLLDAQHIKSVAVETGQAEDPVEGRILRAFTNGYVEGMRRGSRGRLDHS